MIAVRLLCSSIFMRHRRHDLSQLDEAITPYTTGQFMMLDTSTRRNLELVETLREKQKRGSLLWVLDQTRTAMGARMLRTFIEQPLIRKAEILRSARMRWRS